LSARPGDQHQSTLSTAKEEGTPMNTWDDLLFPDTTGLNPEGVDEFIRNAMRWHFGEDTGSPFWLREAKNLDFDPLVDVKGWSDLRLFPNVIGKLRDVSARDLIPRGYGENPDFDGVFESGGTTGAPKRVVVMQDWSAWCDAFTNLALDEAGIPRGVDMLAMLPTGPHHFGRSMRRQMLQRGGLFHGIDMDPRWVKKCAAFGWTDNVTAYVEHLIEQARYLLQTQDIGVLAVTPPLLVRMVEDDELVELIADKVTAILWGGAHMDADTHRLLATDVFPNQVFYGVYGSAMILGTCRQRPGLQADQDVIFDTRPPFITMEVVDPETMRPVDFGQRGQVLMHHVSKNALLPNNLERDTAIRVRPPAGSPVGDSVTAVAPVKSFEDETVIEGVY
jgi:phenylacetate-coenzyme A ligase PaaK-like adenylate-forming protein